MQRQHHLQPVSILLASGFRGWIVSLLGGWLLSIPLFAQETPVAENTELADLLAAARQYEIRTTKPDAPLKLREPPVLNFTNPERNQERGSVFVWMQNDRPAAIGQFFCFDGKDRRTTKHALHSLAPLPLVAKFDDEVAWAPEQPGIVWKSFEEAPAVGPNRTNRMLQMRQLVRRFKVQLIDPKGKATELRLAPRPLFDYSAPKVGVTDGVIFSYVIATDPEAILLVEAFDDAGQTGFRYAFARFHFLRLTAAEGDRVVWDVEHDPALRGNHFGNPATIKKVYNSYHP